MQTDELHLVKTAILEPGVHEPDTWSPGINNNQYIKKVAEEANQ
jgi:hypothetical protein